jgi:tetratricopeptide (TPR) repeat protein
MRRYFLLLFAGCAIACGGQPHAAKGAHDADKTENEVEVPRTVVTPTDASSIPELLSDAKALLDAQRWTEAAAAYDRIYKLQPDGPAGEEAAWGAGYAYDHARNFEPAVARYALYIKRDPDSHRGHQAMVYASSLLVFLGRYGEAGVYAERLLKNASDLSNMERIATLSARALAFIDHGEDQQASYFIEKARNIVEDQQLDRAGQVPPNLAQLYYALGETRRLKAERISFQPVPPNFGAVLEQRCQLLLDAQSAYSDATRAYDPHWSAMAGYRIAELYQRLHQDLMAVQPPANADTERKRQLFQGAVLTRYSVLLSKAKGMAQQTLAMAERTGERSEWVDRTRQALQAIEKAMADEEAALSQLPYTRADFEAYIAEQEAAAAAPPPAVPLPGKAPGTPKKPPAGGKAPAGKAPDGPAKASAPSAPAAAPGRPQGTSPH